MTIAKHQRSCNTCAHLKWFPSVDSPSGRGGNHCNNDSSQFSGTYVDYYSKGRTCHVKKGEAVSNKTNDYIEYQQGVVKLKLQNGKMNLTVAATVAFNSKEREKIEKDLSDVFEVVTLASSKIVTDKVAASDVVEI